MPKRLSVFEKRQRQVEHNLDKGYGSWDLSTSLFSSSGEDMEDIYCFGDSEKSGYAPFLDRVQTLTDLRRGLKGLSPLADDALAVAEAMAEADFVDFKLCLAHERRIANDSEGESKMPKRYLPLLLPSAFLRAAPIAQKFNVPLGVAAVRLVEEGINIFD